MAFFNLRRVNQPGMPLAVNSYEGNFLQQFNDDDYIPADIALQNSDIYAIIFLLSQDLANCKFTADKTRAQGIINNPTDTANAHGFWESMFAQLLLDGNAYAYRWRNKKWRRRPLGVPKAIAGSGYAAGRWFITGL